MESPEEGLLVEQAHPTLRVDASALEALVRRVVRAEGFSIGSLGVILADHETVLDLNRRFLGHDYHTDVLSFPLADDPESHRVEGEVYVDLDTALERHAEFASSFEAEVRRYVVHGLLHLLGHDDATPAQKAAMHALEDRYLGSVEW